MNYINIEATIVGNKAKGRISKRVFQESKARQNFRKTNISYHLIRTRPFVLLPMLYYIVTHQLVKSHTCAITDKQESTVFDLFMSNTKFGFLIMFIQNRNGKLKK